MVFFLSLLSKPNKLIAPSLLKHGLSARFAIIRKTTKPTPIPDSLLKHQASLVNNEKDDRNDIRHDGFIYDNVDSTFLDSLCLLPLTQKVISIEVHDDMMRIGKEMAQKNPSMLDDLAERFWEKMFGKDPSEEENAKLPPALQSFQNYVYPALFPNEIWGDRHRWQFNHRFVMWLRKEFLFAKYGQELRDILSLYPSLRFNYHDNINEQASSQHEMKIIPSIGKKNRDLPSKKMILNAFKMQNWSRERNDDSHQQRMSELANTLGGDLAKVHHSLLIPLLADNTEVGHLSVENLLELTGAHVTNCGLFNLYCEQGNIYEFWTQEYIDGLASYLLDRTAIASKQGKETLILEVGAGDGMLSKHLMKSLDVIGDQRRQSKRYMRKKSDKKKTQLLGGTKTLSDISIPKVIATDDGSWNIKFKTNDILKMDVKEALNKYVHGTDIEQQVIVLCSWMMKGIDWTTEFRAAGVDEYVLIGETDDGCCGHNWKTWGNKDFMDIDEIANLTSENPIPLYKVDGFERIDLNDLSRLQFARYDSQTSRCSSTVSFRKNEP